MDITCIPKTYILYLLGLGFTEEVVARLDCLYAPGTYDLMADNAADFAACRARDRSFPRANGAPARSPT